MRDMDDMFVVCGLTFDLSFLKLRASHRGSEPPDLAQRPWLRVGDSRL